MFDRVVFVKKGHLIIIALIMALNTLKANAEMVA